MTTTAEDTVFLHLREGDSPLFNLQHRNPTPTASPSLQSNLLTKPAEWDEFLRLLINSRSEEEIPYLLHLLSTHPHLLLSTCVHLYGERCVRGFMSNLNRCDHIYTMLSAIGSIAPALATNVNGWHVIKYCVTYYPFQLNQPILIGIADSCLDVAKDKYGSCVLIDCMILAEGEVEERFMHSLATNALVLAQDPYGNFILQSILKGGEKISRYMGEIIAYLCGNFMYLSTNRYGSNIVEHCIKYGGRTNMIHIIEELIDSPEKEFMELLENPYGSFVIETAMELSTGKIQDDLVIAMEWSKIVCRKKDCNVKSH